MAVMTAQYASRGVIPMKMTMNHDPHVDDPVY